MARIRRIAVIGGESNFGREMLRGMHAYCRACGNWEFHLFADNSPDTIKKARFTLSQWKADGIIAHVHKRRLHKLIYNAGIPVVNTSGVRNLKVPTVIMDNEAIGRIGARYFLNNGFKNFAYIALTNELFSQTRYNGFAAELRTAGFPCDVFTDQCNSFGEINWVQNRRDTDRWLLSLKKPVALMCMYDVRGQEINVACRRLGLRVPDDIAVIGVGNENIICVMSTPPLSSIDANISTIGYEAMRLLDHMLHGGKPPLKPILIAPGQVVERQSSAIIAIDDAEIAAAVRYIRDHAGQLVSVKDLLQKIPISRRAMERRFKKLIGRTPHAEIARVRIERATKLLAETDWTIHQVARHAGFTNHGIFSVFFRNQLGMTPTQYRKNSRLGSPAEIKRSV